MLKLAGFNSTIYSFNKKTGVSFTPNAYCLSIGNNNAHFLPVSSTMAALLFLSLLAASLAARSPLSGDKVDLLGNGSFEH